MSLAGAAENGDRWRLCPPVVHGYLRPQAQDSYPPGTTEILADEAEIVDDEVSTYRGDVQVTRDDKALVADEIRHDSVQGLFEFSGNAEFWDRGLFWAGQKGSFDSESDRGRLEDGEYHLLERRGHGHVRIIATDGEQDISRLKDVDYTTCPGREPLWYFTSDNIKLDHNTDIGVARDVIIRVKNVPVFYTPFLTFPLSDKRKSGLLAPTLGSSNESGFTLAAPYYWNIAPNQDATFTPRIMSNRGIMLEGEYRYLLQNGRGQVDLRVLPNDSAFDDQTRSFMGFRHFQNLFTNGSWAEFEYFRASDKEYFEDFGDSLGVASTRFLPQRAEIFYWGPSQRFWVWPRFESFQSVDRSLPPGSRPYKRLPQVLFRSNLPVPDNRFNVQLWGETTYFDRDDSVTGTRLELGPRLSYPLRSAGMFFIPTLWLRHTQYFLDNRAQGLEDDPSRTVPVFSLDSGVILERNTSLFGRRHLQTLEPRIYYLNIPEEDQDDLPIFDTGEFDISFAQLFRDNRFSGGDRIGDANQLSVALTSRWYDEKRGFERLRGSIGQIFFFDDRQVQLSPGRAAVDDSTSELIGELFVRMSDAWSGRFAFQWDPNASQAEKSTLALRYRPDERTVINLAYRLRRAGTTDVEQTDVSIRWPVNERWSVLGRWNYSLLKSTHLETFAGVEYDSCCWSMKFVARRFLSTSSGQFDNGFFLQVELKGLAGIGRGATSFLKRSIPGYLPLDD